MDQSHLILAVKLSKHSYYVICHPVPFDLLFLVPLQPAPAAPARSPVNAPQPKCSCNLPTDKLSTDARVHLLRRKLEELRYAVDVEFGQLVQLTTGFSRLTIRQLIKFALISAKLRNDPNSDHFYIDMEDFKAAIKFIRRPNKNRLEGA